MAKEGIAGFLFDGMRLPGRIRYESPVDKGAYEKIHQLRSSEINIALAALKNSTWADAKRLLLVGTSEGAVSVARYDGAAFIGKIIYSWSCENNYFVKEHRTSMKTTPVLNIISADDKYFSAKNPYIGSENPKGNCSAAFAQGKLSSYFEVLLIPDAPHTLLNLPAARTATLGFIRHLLNPVTP